MSTVTAYQGAPRRSFMHVAALTITTANADQPSSAPAGARHTAVKLSISEDPARGDNPETERNAAPLAGALTTPDPDDR